MIQELAERNDGDLSGADLTVGDVECGEQLTVWTG